MGVTWNAASYTGEGDMVASRCHFHYPRIPRGPLSSGQRFRAGFSVLLYTLPGRFRVPTSRAKNHASCHVCQLESGP